MDVLGWVVATAILMHLALSQMEQDGWWRATVSLLLVEGTYFSLRVLVSTNDSLVSQSLGGAAVLSWVIYLVALCIVLPQFHETDLHRQA